MNRVPAKRFRLLTPLAAVAALSLLASTGAGCDAFNALLDSLDPPVTRVELINNGDFAVDVVLFISDEQDIPESLLTQDEIGTRLEFSIMPGETASFSRDCDELQAIVIDDADLRVIGGAGPETDSEVLRDGDDFGCRDVIEFRFDHTDLILDFSVQTTVRQS